MNGTGEDRAAGRVLAVVQFQESDDSPVDLRDEDDRSLGARLEVVARFGVVIGEGTRPQRVA